MLHASGVADRLHIGPYHSDSVHRFISRLAYPVPHCPLEEIELIFEEIKKYLKVLRLELDKRLKQVRGFRG